MKYRYLYQTKGNEVKEGVIEARDRADAYTRLRKQHIRPMRVIGDDPIKWQPWAIGAGFVVLCVAIVFLLMRPKAKENIRRCQIVGSSEVISHGLANGWKDILKTKLDCYLASYAQPGWIALPPEVTDEEIELFVKDLETPFSIDDAPTKEGKQLKKIVLAMRKEMKEYLSAGGKVKDYLEFLEDRQDQECDFRNNAVNAVNRAPESMRSSARININVRLKEMGLPIIEE